MHTIDILISLAAERIGCPIAQKPITGPDAPRMITVTSATGKDTEVQIPAKASFETVVALLLAGYSVQ